MINVENVVYQAKINGYYHYYDNNGFISVFDDMIGVNKSTQCLYREKVNCNSRKEFEVEASYVSQKVFELSY
jgi:hypothetical protein